MSEILFILFLLSGALKAFFPYLHIPTMFDFTLLTAFLLSLNLIYNLYQNKFNIKINILSKYSLYLLLTLFTMILFSLFYTSSQNYVYEKILQFFTLLLVFIYPLYIRNFSVEKFLIYFILITIGLTIVFLPMFIMSFQSLTTNYASFKSNPLSVFYSSYLTMGYIIGIALIINTYLSIFTIIKRTIISIFLLTALIITGARGPLFAFIITLFFFFTYKGFKIKRPKITTIFLGSILIIPISIYVLNKQDIGILLERTYNRIVTIKKDSSANDRIEQALYVLNKIDAKHLMFGYGFGSYGYEKTTQDKRLYPHNIILELLFELGSLGVIIYILFLFTIIKRLTIEREFALWALFLYLVLNSIKSLSIVDSRIQFGFFAILLLYHKYQNKLNQEKNQ